MIRQKSDLSENLIISSTPEAERYFERKNDSLNERVEKGELDIEVMPEMIIKDDNDGVPESLLQVLDEDPSSVTPEQLYTTCEIISQGLDRQVQKIEDDFADIANKQDPQADIGTTASPHANLPTFPIVHWPLA